MTVSSSTTKSGPYSGNGVTLAFDYGFKISDEAHVEVILTDVNGVETPLTITTHYSVSGVGDLVGGQVTLVTPPVAGEKVTLLPSVPFVQPLDLVNQGAYYAEVIEEGLDLALQRSLQLKGEVSRAIKVAASSGVTPEELTGQLFDAASEASTGATTATTQAGIAAAKASEASTSATTATTQAGIATTKASEASTSATTATTQAGIATTKASEASTSASTAIAQASIATTKASETVTKAAEALASAASAEALFDAFGDLYLGSKAVNPTLDNDGNPIQDGAVHWNSTAKQWRAYDLGGAEWVSLSSVGSAGLISFTPTGDVQSSNVQAAITELDTEKLDKTEGMHVGTLGEGIDLDAITTAGSYRCSTTQLNVPDTGHGQLLVVRGGGDTIAQIYFPYSNANVWTRQGNPSQVGGPVGGFWRPWARLLNTHDPQIHTGPTQPVGMKNGDIWIEV